MSFLGRIQNPVEAVWVSLKTGDAIKGVLVDRHREFLVLRAAKVGSTRSQDGAQIWTKAMGDLVIPMDNVDWWATNIPIESIE